LGLQHRVLLRRFAAMACSVAARAHLHRFSEVQFLTTKMKRMKPLLSAAPLLMREKIVHAAPMNRLVKHGFG
jgi:hypothetical protein